MAGLFNSRNQRQSAWRDKILKQRCQHGCFDGLAPGCHAIDSKGKYKIFKNGERLYWPPVASAFIGNSKYMISFPDRASCNPFR